MSMYGIPVKLITLVKAMYSNSVQCAVLKEGETTDRMVKSPVWSKARVDHVGLSFLAISCLAHE